MEMKSNRIRGFEAVTGFSPKLPVRSTLCSAGYDFFALEDIEITTSIVPELDWDFELSVYRFNFDSPIIYFDKPKVVKTGVKAYMMPFEFLQLQVRSSLGKQGLIIPNSPAIIDADYYGNEKNEGHIMGMFLNLGTKDITIKKGEHFMQGIFQTYQLADGDMAANERKGGIGSTNK